LPFEGEMSTLKGEPEVEHKKGKEKQPKRKNQFAIS
jgi:hypothetical protein